MKQPSKNAKQDEVYKYALNLYRGNRKKAESYVRGWNQVKGGK